MAGGRFHRWESSFIGGKAIRNRIGPPSCLQGRAPGCGRFGLVTTNSVTQVFQRRVIERHLNATAPISLVMAIPDHPWTKASKDAAAVRIAMTIAEAGRRDGLLRKTTREAHLDTDQ